MMRVILSVLIFTMAVVGSARAGTVRISGIYSDLHYNREGGDLLGVEILIVPTSNGYGAFVQIAEGQVPFVALVPVNVRGSRVEFRLPRYGRISALRFVGRITSSGIVGTWFDGLRTLAPFGSSGVEHLKRGRSYWQ